MHVRPLPTRISNLLCRKTKLSKRFRHRAKLLPNGPFPIRKRVRPIRVSPNIIPQTFSLRGCGRRLANNLQRLGMELIKVNFPSYTIITSQPHSTRRDYTVHNTTTRKEESKLTASKRLITAPVIAQILPTPQRTRHILQLPLRPRSPP